MVMMATRLILPDTSSIALDKLPGVDPAGYAGLEDGVDWHWDRILAGAALSTMLGVGASCSALCCSLCAWASWLSSPSRSFSSPIRAWVTANWLAMAAASSWFLRSWISASLLAALGEHELGVVPGGEFVLARAVAASSAFPPVFPPLKLESDEYAPALPVDYVTLTDGGIYDIRAWIEQQGRGNSITG